MTYKKRKAGFALIELIVVIGIIAILVGLVLPGFNFFRRQSAVENAAQEIMNTLRLAQSKTLSSEGPNNFGVYFAADRFTLFTGQSFIADDPANEEHVLDASVRVSDINLAGSSIIVFARLTGQTDNTGSISVELTSDPAQSKTVFIDSSGIISLAGTSATDNDRQKDSRHSHVLYSQNTQSAATLSLVFPETGQTENINYQNFLTPDKTEFNWVGTVSVAGVNQQLTIHSHSLTAGSTVFCFHRDRRDNSKAIQINLDGQNMINYDATGNITAGGSVWAGEPEAQ